MSKKTKHSKTIKIKLVVFDLDGTLLRDETVCETIALSLGKIERMKELEKINNINEMRAARYEIANWYKRKSFTELQNYLIKANTAPHAVEGCRLLKDNGIQIGIASLTWSFAVEWFAKLFGAKYSLGSVIKDDGKIEHCWPQHKAKFIKKIKDNLNISYDEIAAIGDTWGDVEMLKIAGLPIFVGTNKFENCSKKLVHLPGADIISIANYILQHSICGTELA